MKKIIKIMTGILLVSIVSIAAVYASFVDELEVVNHISMGDINISISEYAKKGKGEVKYQNPSKVVPGQTISKIPRIKNEALPCWIRAKITYNSETKDSTAQKKLELLKDENIGGISEDWVKRGEYYYYTKVLRRQQAVDLFQNISIPAEWTEKYSEQKFIVDIQADAIQAANFRPDFNAMSPWGNEVIQQCVHEQNGALTCRKGERKLSVEFSGRAHKLIAVPDDFFANLETAMPGDVLEDSVMISNTTEETAELFFRTDTTGRSEEQMKMLQDIRFEISQDKKVLYRGTLDAGNLKKFNSLGKFKPGQKSRLKFIVEIPEKWDNAYALKETDVTWIFAANEDEKIQQGIYESSDRDVRNRNTAQEKLIQSKQKKAVKTGDASEPILLTLLLLGSGVIVLIIRLYKGGRES